MLRFILFERIRPSNQWKAVESTDNIQTYSHILAPKIYDTLKNMWVSVGKRGPIKSRYSSNPAYKEVPTDPFDVDDIMVWGRTKGEYLKWIGEDAEFDPSYFEKDHLDHVKSAVLTDKPVPAKVLKDYPAICIVSLVLVS